MPILTFDTLDSVPDGLREHAKPIEGGNGKVNVNVVPTQKIDEFRDNNIALAKERDNLRAQYDPLKAIVGEDLEGFTKNLEELRLTAQRVKDGELKETRGIEEALTKRTEELRKDYDIRLQAEGKEKAAWRVRYDSLDSQYRRSLIASAIKDACMKQESGVETRAVPDIIMVAQGVFKCDDQGRIAPYAGDAPLFGTDGTSHMTPEEWVTKLKEEKPFYFKSSNGGGGGGQGGGGDTTRRVLGMDRARVAGMSASAKLELANDERAKKRA